MAPIGIIAHVLKPDKTEYTSDGSVGADYSIEGLKWYSINTALWQGVSDYDAVRVEGILETLDVAEWLYKSLAVSSCYYACREEWFWWKVNQIDVEYYVVHHSGSGLETSFL